MPDQSDPSFELEKIRAPSQEPSDTPDKETAAENDALKNKALKPVEREAEANRRAFDLYQRHCDHHLADCDQCRQELVQARESLDAAKDQIAELREERSKLRELCFAIGKLTLAGNTMVIIAAALLGVAGGWPGLPDTAKFVLSGAGLAMSVCGAMLVILAVALGGRIRKESSP